MPGHLDRCSTGGGGLGSGWIESYRNLEPQRYPVSLAETPAI
jgi:hypothetical protein